MPFKTCNRSRTSLHPHTITAAYHRARTPSHLHIIAPTHRRTGTSSRPHTIAPSHRRTYTPLRPCTVPPAYRRTVYTVAPSVRSWHSCEKAEKVENSSLYCFRSLLWTPSNKRLGRKQKKSPARKLSFLTPCVNKGKQPIERQFKRWCQKRIESR